MPNKSRQRKNKYANRNKKMGNVGRSSRSAQQSLVFQDEPSIKDMDIITPSAKVAVPVVKQETVRQTYITSELRMIGILAGIMLISLIVLSQIIY